LIFLGPGRYTIGCLTFKKNNAEEGTFALEKFKYALGSWRKTPAIARCKYAKLFHYKA
jgi:hypothetical protein